MSETIVIRETGRAGAGFSATIQFGQYGAPYSITVKDPFSEEEENRLGWYFEEWLRFPFTDKVPAEEAASSITGYGLDLFEQVFRKNPDIYLKYQDLRKSDVIIEIVGSPEFHVLHWEALRDPNQERPLSVEIPIVRKNLEPVNYEAKVQPAPCLRVLLVTARPAGERDVSYRTISRPLVEALEVARVPAQVDIVRPGTFEALVNHLEDVHDKHGNGYYHIIHLDMHGALLNHEQYTRAADSHPHDRYTFREGYAQANIEPYEGLNAFIFFDKSSPEAKGGGNPVSAEDLAKLLNMRQIPIAVINACQSGKQVGSTETSVGFRLLASGVQLVLAMGYSVTVSAAQKLMAKLYGHLLEGSDPSVAIRRGRLELYNDKVRRAAFGQEINLEDWMLPVIYQNQPPDFSQFSCKMPDYREIASYKPPRMTYKFVGRDIDILNLERLLLERRNLQLVRGMGGAGKTTFLHHVGWWWQKTGFVGEVFYFGYDLKAYHLQEIVSIIGKQLRKNLSGRSREDRDVVLRALKTERHLLILDNMESVTGEPLAVKNTLPPDAQRDMKDFLAELVGGRTFVLLGSRGPENWLRQDPLQDGDVYELPGLDYEAQTELADQILRNVNAPYYPAKEEHTKDFKRLLKLLGGYPLAMEVVLANLAKATPADVIDRLQAADVDLDNKRETVEKTESILRCIEYSHGNLSEEAQALLLCLAPFTGVFNVNLIEHYTKCLQDQPPLKGLAYDKWTTVLNEAINWGLFTPHGEFGQMGYLNLHPLFPYFLKACLNVQENYSRKRAIEAAFYQHYNLVGNDLTNLLDSKDKENILTGTFFAAIEEENLRTSVRLALRDGEKFWGSYTSLDAYLDQSQRHENRYLLLKSIVDSRENYKNLDSEMFEIFLRVTGDFGNVQVVLMKYEDAIITYHEVLRFIEQMPDTEFRKKRMIRADTLHQLGVIAGALRQLGTAEGYYNEALQIYIDINDRNKQAYPLHQLGNVAVRQQQWKMAEKYYNMTLKIKEEFNDRHGQAGVFYQLGNVAMGQLQLDVAAGFFNKALQIFIEFKDRYQQASTLRALGLVAMGQQQWETSEFYTKEALKIYIEFNDRYEQAATLLNLGVAALEQRQFAAAEGYYKEALQIFIEFNDQYNQAKSLLQLGFLAEAQERWDQAIDHSLGAAAIFITFEDQRSNLALKTLERIRSSTGDPTITHKLSERLGITLEESESLLFQIDGKE